MKEIKLTQGKVAVVDDDMFDYLNQWKWHYYKPKRGKTGYAERSTGNRSGQHTTIRMHRVIMNTPSGQQVDHKDHNGCHNWRDNMRNCTNSENSKNQSPKKGSSLYKGVSWYQPRHKWAVQITVNYKKIFVGYYSTQEAAARAYDEAARKYHGEFAHLNGA